MKKPRAPSDKCPPCRLVGISQAKSAPHTELTQTSQPVHVPTATGESRPGKMSFLLISLQEQTTAQHNKRVFQQHRARQERTKRKRGFLAISRPAFHNRNARHGLAGCVWSERTAAQSLPEDAVSSPTWSQGLLAVGGCCFATPSCSSVPYLPQARAELCASQGFLYIVPTSVCCSQSNYQLCPSQHTL